MTRARLAPAALLALNVLALSACAQDKGGTATAPVSRGDGAWMAMHERFLKRAAEGGVDLLFLGDSITQGWNDNPTWQRYYAPRHAANFGIGGDRTQHVLWRIDHGELDKIRPKVVVLMIGTNNLGDNTAEEVAEGVRAIVGRVRDKLPGVKVLLLAVFPRGADRDPKQAAAALDPRPARVNALIEPLGKQDGVTYLDIGRLFLDADGRLPKSLMPDFLHLSDLGYRTWAEAMEPTLWRLMED